MKYEHIISKISAIAFALIIAMFGNGCTKDKGDTLSDTLAKTLLSCGDIGIYLDGKPVKLFEKTEHQLYFSREDHTSRLQNDDASFYVQITLNETPREGETVGITFSAEAFGPLGNFENSARIVKIADNKCWLWCEAELMGAIMYWPE